MIDWFTGILPCTHRPLPAGSVVSVDADGAVEWETVKRLTVRGSYESTMKVRSVGSDGEGRATHLYIDGNPSKFLQGHSVIGSDDLQGLVLTVYARILVLLHIPHDLPSYRQVMSGQYKISRIDINTCIHCQHWKTSGHGFMPQSLKRKLATVAPVVKVALFI